MPNLKLVADKLGFNNDDINALTGLVGLAVYLRFQSYHKSLRYLGLYKARGDKGNMFKRCNGKARRYLVMLTIPMIHREEQTWPPRLRVLRRILRELIRLLKEVEPAGV